MRFNRHSAFAVLVFAVLLGCPLISLPSATATATAKWRQMGVPAAEHACMHERGWGSTYTHDVRAPPLGYGSVFWRSWARVIRGLPIVGRPNADTLHQPRPARRPRTRTAERLLAGPRRRAGPQVPPPPPTMLRLNLQVLGFQGKSAACLPESSATHGSARVATTHQSTAVFAQPRQWCRV